ncbi:MAG: radical SAM protein [bacterium]|nr:radical SAM protein [bacterium]MDT8395275.1 radical SAM protein [bacterium]
MSSGTAEAETWISPPPRGGGVPVAVAYPNSYRVGMSNLGYQAVLGAFLRHPGFDARRVFWDGRALTFPDGGRNLDDFAAVAFSVSYQPDLVHLPRMLETGKAPSGKAAHGPIVIGGGVALTINPETSASWFDLVVLGDSEPVLPAIMDGILASHRDGAGLNEKLSSLDGIYIPDQRPRTVKPIFLKDLDTRPARPAVLSKSSEFGELYPVEISRGCSAGCRFCAAGTVCGPVRFLGFDTFVREAGRGLTFRHKIGLVGTAVSYHPRLEEMAVFTLEEGGTFSPSSIRAERITPRLAALLARAGHRTVSLAPEAGTEKLRSAVGKGFSDGLFLEKAGILLEAGIPNIKLYFMAGLPGEEDADMAGIVDLAARLRDLMVRHGRSRGRVGTVTVSVNPFVPKPRTAFERMPMAEESALTRRLKMVRKGLGPVGGVRVQTGSVRGACLDALLSLGGRQVATVLDKLPPGGVSIKRLVKIFPEAEQVLFGRGEGEMPWSFIK